MKGMLFDKDMCNSLDCGSTSLIVEVNQGEEGGGERLILLKPEENSEVLFSMKNSKKFTWGS